MFAEFFGSKTENGRSTIRGVDVRVALGLKGGSLLHYAREPVIQLLNAEKRGSALRLCFLPICFLFPSYPEVLAFNFTLPPSMLTVYSTSLPPFDFRSFVLFLTNFSKSFRLGAPAPSPVSVRASINF